MPTLLKAGGYKTGVIGKVHVAPEAAFKWDYNGGKGFTRNIKTVAQKAKDFVQNAEGQPFFLMVNYFDPHRPFADQSKGVPKNPYTAEEIKPLPFIGVDSPAVRKDVAGYYNCVTRFDAGLGLLMKMLDETGMASNTYVVVVGDHGAPFTKGKGTCYESGLHVPFFLKLPAGKQGGVVRENYVSTIDILPTFLEIAGLNKIDQITGESLLPLVNGKRENDWRDSMPCEYTSHHGAGGYFPRRSIRKDRYKLIQNLLVGEPNPHLGIDKCVAWKESRNSKYEGTVVRSMMDTFAKPPEFELYDLKNDPVEHVNQSSNPEYATVLEEMKSDLLAWRTESADPLLNQETLDALTAEHKDPNGYYAEYKRTHKKHKPKKQKKKKESKKGN